MKNRSSLAAKLQTDKLWAKLRISMQQYLASKPWKSAGISHQVFEKTLQLAPEISDELWDEAHADISLWASIQIQRRPTMPVILIYPLITLGVLALMLVGTQTKRHDTQINIDFDAKKGDESHRQF